MNRPITVTQEGVTNLQPGISISVTTGSGLNGKAVLYVSRHYPIINKRQKFADCGRHFSNEDEAWAFALERGYVRRYYTNPALRKMRLARAKGEF